MRRFLYEPSVLNNKYRETSPRKQQDFRPVTAKDDLMPVLHVSPVIYHEMFFFVE